MTTVNCGSWRSWQCGTSETFSHINPGAFLLMSDVNHVTACDEGKNKTKGEKHLHFSDKKHISSRVYLDVVCLVILVQTLRRSVFLFVCFFPQKHIR